MSDRVIYLDLSLYGPKCLADCCVYLVIIILFVCDGEEFCDVICRKVRLQMKDETEREEADIKAGHAEKLRKLQQDLEQQLTEEKAKIRS